MKFGPGGLADPGTSTGSSGQISPKQSSPLDATINELQNDVQRVIDRVEALERRLALVMKPGAPKVGSGMEGPREVTSPAVERIDGQCNRLKQLAQDIETILQNLEA